MSDDYPLRVSLWRRVPDTTQWSLVTDLTTWTACTVEPRYLDGGTWSLSMPYDVQGAKVDRRDLLTFDLIRDGLEPVRLMTGVIKTKPVGADERGKVTQELAGVGALGLLGGVVAWPAPLSPWTAQPVARYDDTGPAEDVLRRLFDRNWNQRLGMGAAIATSQGRGGTIKLSLRGHNMLNMARIKAEPAGLAFRMGLEPLTDTRSQMRIEFYLPQDRSQRVWLSNDIGSLRTWTHEENAPTATRALVAGQGAGAARVFRQVTGPAQEVGWYWPIETFVDARDVDNTTDLDVRGREALADATATSVFDLEAVEAEGIRYGQHFTLGDTVTVDLATGVRATDVLRGVTVTGGEGGVKVRLLPGNPDAARPIYRQAAIIRGLRTDIAALQREV